MQKYQLGKMVQRRKGSTGTLPVILESIAFEKAYLAALRKFLKRVANTMRDVIVPAYTSRVTTDADESTFEAFRRIIDALVRSLGDTVRQLLELEATKHTDKFMENARRAFGVNLSGIIKAEDLEAYLEQVTLRNTGLIKGLSDDLIRKTQTTVTTAMIEGRTTKQLQAELKKLLQVSDSRARLIARDQAAKFNSEMNEIRHKQAGIEKYIWRTANDERVRPRHARLEGVTYAYGERTGAEEGLPPGRPIQCRCIAQAIVEF